MQPRYGAHLGAQGRLLRGFADKCEDSLFEEPLATNKKWLLNPQREDVHDPEIDPNDDPDGHALSERTVVPLKLDQTKCEELHKHFIQESSTLPLALLIAGRQR